ncbi:MAG: DUF3253 domain-containing protein [Thalassobaculaceae bacterium]|nr:DUF3253 domain-containing protein [Thalassobaculaceae bacterium]
MEPDQATAERLQALILEQCRTAGPGKSISPDAVARAAGGDPNDTPSWRPLLRSVRKVAAELQDQGAILALRKGKPVDIRSAKGVIRLAIAEPAGP